MAATAAPAVASTVGFKNMVIAPLTKDDDTGTTYGDLQKVAGAIEASITPENNDPDIQYYDDIEGDVLYPDPELAFKTKLADLPLTIQEMISLAPAVLALSDAEIQEFRIPIDNGSTSQKISGMSVLVPDRQKNAKALKEFLLGN